MKHFSLTCITIFFVTLTAELAEPYKSIKVLPEDLHGWFQPSNRKNLARFIATFNPNIIVELGSWLGLSTIYMASLMQDSGKLYAIDNWTAEGDIAILNADESVVGRIPKLYQQFLSALATR